MRLIIQKEAVMSASSRAPGVLIPEEKEGRKKNPLSSTLLGEHLFQKIEDTTQGHTLHAVVDRSS